MEGISTGVEKKRGGVPITVSSFVVLVHECVKGGKEEDGW